jgi:hypothetical protein
VSEATFVPCPPGMPGCEHNWAHLSQDRRNVGFDRNPIWLVEDVFFCSKCLEYRRVGIEKRTPRSDGGEYVERLR